ncbi:hypothetical protein CNMCM5793_007270 [Aspergillus hiratsukae]|uniref:Chromo domain-containing protein n=1 Tax=Aspergillus hiratsukae TaxID=1194566 RepID=A0A8H6PHZ2_9EURO|nr:hypothetical protein CNMCM5793_007270 [Aspergillus hiratsukae]
MAHSCPSSASRKLYLKGKIGGEIFSGEGVTRTKFLEYCRTNPCQVFEAILTMQEYFIGSTTSLRGRGDEYSKDIAEEADDTTGDEQYEVDYILDSRAHDGNLQYRVKWAGYKDDPEWYGAENFERAPYRLQEFHFRYPWKPGPPKDLDDWLLRAGDDELTSDECSGPDE